MSNRRALWITSLVSLLLTMGIATYLFRLGVLADEAAESASLPLWALIAGPTAFLVSIVSFVRWGAVRATERIARRLPDRSSSHL